MSFKEKAYGRTHNGQRSITIAHLEQAFGSGELKITFMHTQYGPGREKTCLREFGNNTGADQPAHSRSLISAFVIRVLESTITKLATSEISVF